MRRVLIKMRIAIFTDTFLPDVNGVAKTLGRFTAYLEKTNNDFIVISPKQQREEKTNHIYPQASFPFPLYSDCRFSVPNKNEIRQLLKSFQPDIIHVATPFSIGLCGVQLAKKMHIPLVGSYHTDFDHYLQYYHLTLLKKPLWRYMEWFHQPMQRLYVPSSYTLKQLSKRNFHHLDIWKRGVDTQIFHPNYKTTFIREKYKIKEKYILSYVGRLAPEKNVDILTYLFHSLPSYIRDDIHWLIVGDGPSKDGLIEHSSSQITFTGFLQQSDIAPILAASDLFVFPSASETFGNVVLEALACGTPVIGANAGGVKTIIQEGFTGVLCHEDDKKAFSKAILSVLMNQEWYTQLQENAIRYAQKQKWDDQFEHLLNGYENVIQESLKQSKHA
jgi:glycosyltransferase involved in cell wall biosynthesis